jgi:hypothetical protein
MTLKSKNIFLSLLGISICLLIVTSCKKDTFVNPYDDPSLKAPAPTNDLATIDPSNFAYLQSNIFQPTCANSGCHDGTFPPDYRTISSSYNTLVYQKPVNTNGNTFRYRVFPYKADSSILYHRMTVVMGSGTMPLYAQDDWNAVKDANILAIKNWINTGAKDMFGNYPKKGNKQPVISGFLAFPSGNTSSSYSRGGGNIAPIDVPANSSIDLWFLISDDSTSASGFVNDTCKLSKSMFSFTSTTNTIITYSSSGLTGNDFTGASGKFMHKTTISTNGYLSGNYIYVRAYINDGSQLRSTEIPNNGTSDNIAGYFALKIQ